MLLSIDEERNVIAVFPATGEALAVPDFTPAKLEAIEALDSGDDRGLRLAASPAEAVAYASRPKRERSVAPRSHERRRHIVPRASELTLPEKEESPLFYVSNGRLQAFGEPVADALTLLLWKVIMEGASIEPAFDILRGRHS